MLGINSTGRPDKTDYLLGRGCLFVTAEGVSTGTPVEYRDLGNAPNFSLSIDIEELTHRASMCTLNGGAVDDVRIVLRQTINISFTLEEINHDNFALFVQGTTDTPANPAVAGLTAYNITTDLELGVWYDIKSTANVRAMGIDSADLTITQDPGGTPAVLTLNTDYLVDEKAGSIFFVPGSSATQGETIQVVLAANAGAPATIQRVSALKTTASEVALKAHIENANNSNEVVVLEFFSVVLTGDGEFSSIGDELAQMNFTGVATINQNTVVNGVAGATLLVSKAVG